jgi:hypothetical protein
VDLVEAGAWRWRPVVCPWCPWAAVAPPRAPGGAGEFELWAEAVPDGLADAPLGLAPPCCPAAAAAPGGGVLASPPRANGRGSCPRALTRTSRGVLPWSSDDLLRSRRSARAFRSWAAWALRSASSLSFSCCSSRCCCARLFLLGSPFLEAIGLFKATESDTGDLERCSEVVS